LRRFTADVDAAASGRSSVSFQHPRGADEQTWTTQLVQPVTTAVP